MIYVTSDIHGKASELAELLDAAGFGESDYLYVIGDVIDRHGDGGAALLLWLMDQPNVTLLLGNHEDMLLQNYRLFDEVTLESVDPFAMGLPRLYNWMRNGGDVTIKGLSRLSHEDRRDILAYLGGCPLTETLCVGERTYVLAHGGLGGFSADRPLEDYSYHEILWERPTLDTEYYTDKTVILGHTPTAIFGSEHRNRMIKTKTYYNIDTGAAMPGGHPMLLCLDTLAEYYYEDDGSVTKIE